MPFSAWQRLLQWKPGTPGGRLGRLCELAVRPVPGQSLAAFRIAFGLLMLNDVVFLLRGGWLTRFYIDRDTLFPYFGLEVPSLPAPWLRGVCCVLVALGAPYRLAIRGFMGPARIHADVGKSVNGRPRQRFQGKDHARFEIVALSEQLCDEARRRPAVDEPQGFSDPRLEPGFRSEKAAEGAFAVIEQEGFVRGHEVRDAGLSAFRCHLDLLRSPGTCCLRAAIVTPGRAACKAEPSAARSAFGLRVRRTFSIPIRFQEGQQEMKRAISAALAALVLMAPIAAAAHSDHGSGPDRNAIEGMVRDYLLKNPEVIEEAIRLLRAKRQEEERKRAEAAIQENGEALRAHPLSPVSGNTGGDVTVVEFFDYRCGFCKRALPAVTALLKEDANVRVVWKEFPILGPVSLFAARAAMAADRQGKYYPFHLALMKEPELSEGKVLEIAVGTGLDLERLRRDMEDPAIQAYLDETQALARKIGISGTPAFVVGSRLVPGAVDAARLLELVAAARAGGGRG